MSHHLDIIINQEIDDVPGNTFQDKLDHLSYCNCCERHKINKPSVFSAWQETEFHFDQDEHSCMCNCRHIARLICRQCDDYQPPPLIRFITPTSVIDA